MHRREFLGLASAALATGFSTEALSQAQNWPERPVKLIVPYAAGAPRMPSPAPGPTS